MLHPQTVQRIWEIFGKAEVDFLASKNNSRCPTYFSKDRNVFFKEKDSAGNQANQGTRIQGSLSGPVLEEPTLVLRAVLAAHCSPGGRGCGPAVCPSQKFVWLPGGPRHPHLLGSIAWTSLPYRLGSFLHSWLALTIRWTSSV